MDMHILKQTKTKKYMISSIIRPEYRLGLSDATKYECMVFALEADGTVSDWSDIDVYLTNDIDELLEAHERFVHEYK